MLLSFNRVYSSCLLLVHLFSFITVIRRILSWQVSLLLVHLFSFITWDIQVSLLLVHLFSSITMWSNLLYHWDIQVSLLLVQLSFDFEGRCKLVDHIVSGIFKLVILTCSIVFNNNILLVHLFSSLFKVNMLWNQEIGRLIVFN